MSFFTDLIEDYVDLRMEEIYQGLPAKIEKFDKETMRAEVVPLLSTVQTDGVETPYPVLSEVPVLFFYSCGFYIRPDYQKGDFVWLTFSSYDYDDALDEKILPENNNRFDLSKCAIANGLPTDKFKAPDSFGDEGLLIGHGDGGVVIQVQKDKIIGTVGKTEIEIADESVTAKGADFDFNDGNLEVLK